MFSIIHFGVDDSQEIFSSTVHPDVDGTSVVHLGLMLFLLVLDFEFWVVKQNYPKYVEGYTYQCFCLGWGCRLFDGFSKVVPLPTYYSEVLY